MIFQIPYLNVQFLQQFLQVANGQLNFAANRCSDLLAHGLVDRSISEAVDLKNQKQLLSYCDGN